jgi:hypothetical protein
MEYKGYTVTAEVESFDFYTVDEDGRPVEFVENGNGGDVTGYRYDNSATGDEFFVSVSQSDEEDHRFYIDQHIEELAKAVV